MERLIVLLPPASSLLSFPLPHRGLTVAAFDRPSTPIHSYSFDYLFPRISRDHQLNGNAVQTPHRSCFVLSIRFRSSITHSGTYTRTCCCCARLGIP
ncbi:hypothetical protein F5051DRAFT_162889 [Lentinula edodes]|nr:hypothetical protein F5051DRAFT_162889 [Lentinula edodes]